MRVVLASASPRRREILARIAYPFEVSPAHLDEARLPGEDPRAYVERLAREKAAAVACDHRQALVVGADTTVALGDRILGKPADPEDAAQMLGALSGRRHEVLSGVAVARDGEVVRSFVTASEVVFRALSDDEIRRYAATDEPSDKAGSYAIQGGASAFVQSVRGSVTNIIGLPLDETREAIQALGGPMGPGPSADGVGLRFRSVAGEMAARAVACGRDARSVRLLTVVKGHPPEMAAAAIEAGACDVGENYVQEARIKRQALADRPARWHLIGPLQRNKAGVAAGLFDVVHTIERAETARALARRVPDERAPLEVLLQVNVARDRAKAGIAPEEAADLLEEVATFDRLVVKGLMTIGKRDASAAAAAFDELRHLRDGLRATGHEDLIELSMGTSDDYDIAIERGATIIRLGTAVLGPRPPRDRGA